MKRSVIALVFLPAFILVACNGLRQETGEVIGKSGEAVGKSAGEFFSGVGQGVEAAIDCKISLSDELKARGLDMGTYMVEDGEGGDKNVLILYLTYNKDFSGNIQARVKEASGAEKGRTVLEVSDKAGSAGYVEFTFDPRTRIQSKNLIELTLVP